MRGPSWPFTSLFCQSIHPAKGRKHYACKWGARNSKRPTIRRPNVDEPNCGRIRGNWQLFSVGYSVTLCWLNENWRVAQFFCFPSVQRTRNNRSSKRLEDVSVWHQKPVVSTSGPVTSSRKGAKKNVATDASSISLTSGPTARSHYEIFKRNLLARK